MALAAAHPLWPQTGAGASGGFGREIVSPEEVAGAVQSARWRSPCGRGTRANVAIDAGPAVDYVCDAVQKARELALPVVGRAWTRDVRLARTRDVSCSNDQPGPT
jgi:hypothetical protein